MRAIVRGRRWLLGALLLLQGCGDDGHVVGDMASGGSGGTESIASSNSGSGTTNTSSNNGSGGSSSTTANATSSTTSATGGSASGGSSAGGAASGGTSSGGMSSGGTTAGTGTTGSGGTGMVCPDGQTWCPGCTVNDGYCAVDCLSAAVPTQACPECSTVDNEADCNLLVNCHSVYQDLGTCGCGTPGCCTRFSFCAPGETADCEGANVDCEAVTPLCEPPTFAVSYSGTCYEGCVKVEDCATPPGAGGSGGTSADVCPCDPDVCADTEQMCLMNSDCVLASGPIGNGICRSSDATCYQCKCASPDTPIATASGDRAIRDLRVGDLVYSVDHDATVLVPIRQVNRTPVSHHRVLRVEFGNGSKFEMSGGHPTAAGVPLSGLVVGQTIGGQRVTRITEIDYEHPFTYDILPDSETGSYFADGVLMGSTLHRGVIAEPTDCEVTNE